MSEKPSGILALVAQGLIEVYRPIVMEMAEALAKVTEKLNDLREELGEQLENMNEREKKRAYEHLVTPPVDHTTAHVTHTHTKPPRPARMYRRRTP